MVGPGEPLPIRIDDWISAHIVWTRLGQIMQYQWSYRSSSNVVSPTTLNAFCQQLWNLVVVPWKTIHSASTSLLYVSAESNYPDVENYAGIYNAPAPTVGNAGGELSPGNVALAVAKISGLRGRRKNGRMFLGDFTESQIAGDTANAAYMTAAALFVAQHLTPIVQDSITFSATIPSRRDFKVTDVTRLRMENILDSQRRRLTGRGS